ncbi:MAG: hypothetical protein QXQ94_07425 [Candidatus Bathyarchaeia archaeon]
MVQFRSLVLWGLPSINELPAFERWYKRFHGPEICRRFGPWLTRLVSYKVVPPPPEAEQIGYLSYRLTEGWWLDFPKPYGTLLFTPPPNLTKRIEWCCTPWQPTEDFFGGGKFYPEEKTVLRWIIFFKYPEGVPLEEGEKWYLNIHAKETMKQLNLIRFFSYRTIKLENLPGHWGSIEPSPWVRVSELWYENYEGWRKSIIESPPDYTPLPGAKYNKYPFLKPGVDFVSAFILEQPDDDWLGNLSPSWAI